MRRIARGAAVLLCLLPLACAAPVEQAPPRPASAKPPEGCGKNFSPTAPLLTLAPTRPAAPPAGKGEAYQFAHEIKVHADLAREGAWTDYTDGWSILSLRVTSAEAKSLSVHLSRLELPARTQIWFCSADRRYKQGPYREAVGGDLWTAVVPGAEGLLQVDVPTADRHRFKGELAEAFGGFR